jgi:hemoglobin
MSDRRDELPDIETRADCERLVRAFYGKALEDPIIGFLFTDVAKLDLEAHIPQITSFWETVLLDAHSYSGGAFRPHAELHMKAGLRPGHFERWLKLWFGTVDDMFAGERANAAKIHALRVAQAFMRRLEGFPSPLDRTGPVPTRLAITHHGGDAA